MSSGLAIIREFRGDKGVSRDLSDGRLGKCIGLKSTVDRGTSWIAGYWPTLQDLSVFDHHNDDSIKEKVRGML